jgi:hypothetical protein
MKLDTPIALIRPPVASMASTSLTGKINAPDRKENPVKNANELNRKRRRPLIPFPLGRRIAIALAFALLCGLLASGWSLGTAVFASTNDPLSAKVAEWARSHGMGGIVTGLETIQYRLNPPKLGGTTKIPHLKSRQNASQMALSPRMLVQDPIPSIVTPALPNEGIFQTVVTSHRLPVVQVAYLRPDRAHTSYLSAVIWMSGQHTRLEQHPGSEDPGHLSYWSNGSSVRNSAASGLVAVFNGGFKIKDSHGGFYANHHTVGVLRNGSASLVVYRDGHTEIGVWGRDVQMTPGVDSVRQNLQLLVDNRYLVKNIDAAVKSTWGVTVGASTFVWRSGIGITVQGDLVYAVGDALSARNLATLLLHAGAVRAMQLDINKTWTSYMWFTQTHTGKLTPHKAINFSRPAGRYFTRTSRDFFAVYYR